jgi:hypothetical protein
MPETQENILPQAISSLPQRRREHPPDYAAEMMPTILCWGVSHSLRRISIQVSGEVFLKAENSRSLRSPLP